MPVLLALATALAASGSAAETQPVVLEKRIAASSDDAEEEHPRGNVRLSSRDLEMAKGDVEQTIGLRFRDLQIPPAARIHNAYIQFTVDDPSAGEASLVIQGEAADNAPTFKDAARNISSRPRTSAKVTWVVPSWDKEDASGLEQRTPDLAAVIEEIVGRPGWAGGNSLVLVISGSGTRLAEAFEGSRAAAPLLHIEYLPRQ